MSISNPPGDPGIPDSLVGWLDRVRQELNKPRRPLYIPVTQFSGYQRIVSGANFNFTFLGTGTPELQEINSLGIVGARIEAVDDACHHLFYVPKDFNVGSNIKVEIEWTTNNNTTSNTATWKVRYSATKDGEAFSAATTELNSVITADNVLGSWKRAIAPFGLIYNGLLEHSDLVHLEVSLGAVSGLNPASDQIFLLGIVINDEG